MLGRNLEHDTDAVTYEPDFHSFQICGAFYPLANSTKTFPGLNDMLRYAEKHPCAYNTLKRDYERIAMSAIRVGLGRWKPRKGVVIIPHYVFCEPKKGKKRDYDNIAAAGRKIINDALVKSHYLEDDSPDYLEYGTNTFKYADIPYIKVYLEERSEDLSQSEECLQNP